MILMNLLLCIISYLGWIKISFLNCLLFLSDLRLASEYNANSVIDQVLQVVLLVNMASSLTPLWEAHLARMQLFLTWPRYLKHRKATWCRLYDCTKHSTYTVAPVSTFGVCATNIGIKAFWWPGEVAPEQVFSIAHTDAMRLVHQSSGTANPSPAIRWIYSSQARTIHEILSNFR